MWGGEWLTVFRQEVVRPADDERHDERGELLELLLAARLHLIARVRVAPADDRVLEVLAEVALRAEVVRVREVEQREVFGEVILVGRGWCDMGCE